MPEPRIHFSIFPLNPRSWFYFHFLCFWVTRKDAKIFREKKSFTARHHWLLFYAHRFFNVHKREDRLLIIVSKHHELRRNRKNYYFPIFPRDYRLSISRGIFSAQTENCVKIKLLLTLKLKHFSSSYHLLLKHQESLFIYRLIFIFLKDESTSSASLSDIKWRYQAEAKEEFFIYQKVAKSEWHETVYHSAHKMYQMKRIFMCQLHNKKSSFMFHRFHSSRWI